MPDAPWLTPAAIDIAHCIAASHQSAFAWGLLAGPSLHEPATNPRLLAQELFAAATVVLAHDGAPLDHGEGPRLIYANRAALTLWRRPWASMVGMPSSQTAEADQRASRRQALASAQEQQAISDYSGIRIDSAGRRFVISSARIWTLHTQDGTPCGQAAAFNSWHWL